MTQDAMTAVGLRMCSSVDHAAKDRQP